MRGIWLEGENLFWCNGIVRNMAAQKSIWKYLAVIVLIAFLVFAYKYQSRGSSQLVEKKGEFETVSKSKYHLVKQSKLKKSKSKRQQIRKLKSNLKKNSKRPRPRTSSIPLWFRTTKKSSSITKKKLQLSFPKTPKPMATKKTTSNNSIPLSKSSLFK